MRRPCEQRSYNAILIAVLSRTYRSRRARSDGGRVKCVVSGFGGSKVSVCWRSECRPEHECKNDDIAGSSLP
jgi:hypothetical protein